MNMKVSLNEIEKLDEQNMLEKLKGFPSQCEKGYSFTVPPLHRRKFKKIIFCGMGGSAIAGDIIETIAYQNSRIPCTVNRDYSLPFYADKDTLVIVISYSGNTEETISALNAAKQKGSAVVGISSNGIIEKIATSDGIPFVKIPKGYPPRCALGYIFFSVYKMVSSIGLVPEIDTKLFQSLRNWTENFYPEKENNPALAISGKFYNRIPLIYSSGRLLPAAARWKTQIAENSKSFAFINVLPEMNHNEIMSWRYPDWFIKKCMPVFITSKNEHPRTKLRFEITEKIISGVQPEVLHVKAEGRNLLEEIFYLTILGDWISFYLAILNRVDPTEIREINILKEQMGGGRR